MRLVWKLLRQHISIPQFLGFFLANLVGVVIILLGIQVYNDIQEVYTGEDSFMKADYIIVNKYVGSLTTVFGGNASFSEDEIKDFKSQPFVERLGVFTSTDFTVQASFDILQFATFSTDMFFESVPDEFVDVKSSKWAFREGDEKIPIILPRNYLDLYNFGFAQSRNLPKLSEGILGAMNLNISISGGGNTDRFIGKIVGFSNRLNTILVPQSFMNWANEKYTDERAKTRRISRIIAKVNNPTDERLATYLQDKGYETDQSKLDASKTAYLMRMVLGIVMGVGLVICLLALYILMLSVYLLVEKNSGKLENLLLIGYSPNRVALPYQTITVGLNVLTLIIALIIVTVVRSYYLKILMSLFPDMEISSMAPVVAVGIALLIVVSAINIIAVRQKIQSIWRKKD